MATFHRLVLLSSLLICVLCASAAQEDDANPSELDFETNLNVPEVPEKASSAIVQHMSTLSQALKKKGLDSDLYRRGEIVQIVILCSDLFAPNDTVLLSSEKIRKSLASLKPLLENPTMYKIVIAVYADDTGDDVYCDNLTDLRANAIDDFLSSLVDAENINIIPYGMGQTSPRVPNTSIQNRAFNRRAEIFIVPEWNMVKDAKSGKLSK